MRSIATLALLATVVAAPLSAQVRGLPVVNNGVPTGIGLAADVGFANQDFGKATTFGVSAAVGLGFVGIGGAVSRTEPDNGPSGYSQAVSASLNILGGPLVPIRVTVLGGVGQWKAGSETVRHIPVSIGLSATIPIPALSIKPWIAPRFDRVSVTNGGSDNRFAIAGGVELAMLNGLSLRASYDRLFVSNIKPGIFSVGVGFAP